MWFRYILNSAAFEEIEDSRSLWDSHGGCQRSEAPERVLFSFVDNPKTANDNQQADNDC